MDMTIQQQAVIDHPGGDLLVFAMAGTGKTTVLILKIKKLIEAGVRPESVLLTTFAKRGAEDMRRRAAELHVPSGVEYRTLHSVAWGILRRAPTARKAVVPKRWAMVKVVKRELRRLADGGTQGLPKPSQVFGEIGLAKAALVWPELPAIDGRPDGVWFERNADGTPGARRPAYLEWATTRKRMPIDSHLAEIVDQCYRALEIAMRAPERADTGATVDNSARWVSFDDMLALTARCILQRAPWVMPYQGQFKWVLVDEVQDNNEPQWILAKFLTRRPEGSLVAVGDAMQSIFAFRGAQPGLMREFAESGAKIQPLSFNFRCGQAILDTANKVLGRAEDRVYDGLLERGRGPEAVGVVRGSTHATPQEEAQAVVGEIESAINDGADANEIAVLYRINAQSGAFEMELIKRRLPYKVAGSSFFARGEIKAAIGYLAAALNPDDEEAWSACNNAPLRKLGAKFNEQFPSLTKAREGLRAGALRSSSWRAGFKEAEGVVEAVKELLAAGNVAGAVEFVFEDARVREYYREDGADEEDETEVDEACAALVACASSLTDGAVLVSYARDMHKTGREDHNGERMVTPRVTLSTVHKAKGLEWDRVFVAGMNENLFPFRGADLQEEVRLAYVSLTRPREVLRVTCSAVPSILLNWMELVVTPAKCVEPSPCVTCVTAEKKDAPKEGAA